MYCKNCNTTYSKQNIYWNKVDKILYGKTVFEIEEITRKEFLTCPCCGLMLEPVFDQWEYIEDIRERFSSWAMLLLMQDDSWIVGFMDGHISDYDTIYNRDLSYRYPADRKQEIADAIESTLDQSLPEEMFSCSSMGTTQSYMHFKYIYWLLHNFFWNFPENHHDKLGISELNSGWSLDKIYSSLWAENIWVSSWEQNYETDSYSSGLFIQKNLWRVYKLAFSPTFKDFMKWRIRQGK